MLVSCLVNQVFIFKTLQSYKEYFIKQVLIKIKIIYLHEVVGY